ncbi:MAG: hypothetical protein ABIY70_13810 [Capsulimonas sp.]|uniref:hypothetical protein n=1 Tax=Capsulimonas sp. TaxID=2494211 RepID=UPI00326606DC
MTHDPLFIWCRVCEGAYAIDEVQRGVCPLCGAPRAPGRWMEWERFQSLHPNHPRVPTAGMRYRLANDDVRAELYNAPIHAVLTSKPTRAITAQEMPQEIIVHWMTQGVMRGCFFGALYGIFFFFYGVLPGAVIGLVAGLMLGLLNGVFLAAVHPYYLRRTKPKPGFVLLAMRISPIFTSFSALALSIAVNLEVAEIAYGAVSLPTPSVWLLYIVIPSLIAGFAAWQAAWKMEVWYAEPAPIDEYSAQPIDNGERPTVEKLSIWAMTRALFWYCFKEGARLGFFYGAIYGVFFFIVGALFGCVYGLIAGMAAGLLNGLALSIINAAQRKTPPTERHFLHTAAYVGPILTFATCYGLFRLSVGMLFNFNDNSWWTPNFLYDLVPSLLAAFLAWHAARDMGKWYFE